MRPRGPTAEPRPLRFSPCVTGCHHWDPALIYIARLLGILARNRRSFAHKICARHIVMVLPRHNRGEPTKDPCPRYIRPLSAILLSERQLSEGNFNLYAESRAYVTIFVSFATLRYRYANRKDFSAKDFGRRFSLLAKVVSTRR